MNKRKPGKQRWRGSASPTDAEIQSGRRGFGPITVARIESLAASAGLFPVFVGPRIAGASKVARCYLFFSEGSFHRREENLACIDGSASHARLLVRPFGRAENRVTLLSSRWRSRFQRSDLPDWQHMILNTSDDWTAALHVMSEIKSGYQRIFDIS
jgi:hypothetical protein